MINFSQEQINEFKKLEGLYNENAGLLSCEEILEDENKTIFLTKQNAKIKNVVNLYNNLNELEKQLKNLEELKNTKDLFEMICEEKQNLTRKIEKTKEDLVREYNIYVGKVEKIKIEIDFVNNSEKIFKMLNNLILNICNKNNYEYSTENLKNSRIYLITGYNCFSIFEKISGSHKTTDEIERINVFVYFQNFANLFSENDELKIEAFRSSGAGGQHINKTESAIRITHIKTGLVSTCQDQKTQFQNKKIALENLKNKVNNYYIQNSEKEIKKQKQKQIDEITMGKTSFKYNFETEKITGKMNLSFNEFILGSF